MEIDIELMGDLRTVAQEAGCSGEQETRFVEYMCTRWPDSIESKIKHRYAAEWAGRFSKGMEWAVSDLEGQRILLNMLFRRRVDSKLVGQELLIYELGKTPFGEDKEE